MGKRYVFIFFTLILSACNLNNLLQWNGEDLPSQDPPPPVCDNQVSDNFGGGYGTSLDPYRICSIPQWNYFAENYTNGAYYALEEDLDFNGLSYNEIKTVGEFGSPFNGSFDGKNYIISNVTIDSGTNGFALFEYTNDNLEIKNLNLQNFDLTAGDDLAVLIAKHTGSLGQLVLTNISLSQAQFHSDKSSGLVKNSESPIVASEITLNDLNFPPADQVGGVVGALTSYGNFDHIIVNGFDMANGINQKVGPLVGSMGYSGTHSTSFTNITASNLDIWASWDVSGVLGYISAPNGTLSMSNITVSGNINASGAAGVVGNASLDTLLISKATFSGTLPYPSNLTSAGIASMIFADTAQLDQCAVYVNGITWTGVFGGIVGQFTIATLGTITDSLAVGNFTTTDTGSGGLGGLIGTSNSTGAISVTNSYYSGSIVLDNKMGCITAINSGTAITYTDVYYDSTNCSRQAEDSGPKAGVTGSSYSVLTNGSPLTNWDTSKWVFTGGQLPTLLWLPL